MRKCLRTLPFLSGGLFEVIVPLCDKYLVCACIRTDHQSIPSHNDFIVDALSAVKKVYVCVHAATS